MVNMNLISNAQIIIRAAQNITDILNLSIKHTSNKKSLVIYDIQDGLTRILLEAYKISLPSAKFIDFDTLSKDDILLEFDQLKASDLVVLLQSSNFRLDDFRIRLHLFNKKFKVIEHMHLYRNEEANWDVYVDSLSYDTQWYHTMGHALHDKLSAANQLRIISGKSQLTVTGGVEVPKLNIGDYTGMENIGGTFPIGEVFTESKDFAQMNGTIKVYAFASQDFTISFHEPFEVQIEKGLIVGYGDNAPQDFKDIVEVVKQYERPLIREIGFGLNRAITKERHLGDITAFERILGMHMSLGEKHSVYKKPDIRTNKSKFHIDLFLQIDQVLCDRSVIFEGGEYCNLD
jgi:aminopeptidase